MIGFLLRRLSYGLLAVFILTVLVFVGVRISGDPVALMFQAGVPTEAEIKDITHHLGLDQPYLVQYLRFIKQIVVFDLGKSYHTNQDVSRMISDRLGATLILAACSMLIAVLIAFPIGIISALKRGSLLDFFGQVFAVSGISLPNFWLGIMFILYFAVYLGWFPPSGFEGPQYIILPAFTQGLISSGFLARLVRSSMLDVMRQNYIVTAQAKGITQWKVVIFHGLRNALIPTVTFFGLQFGVLLGGTVIIEQVFSWPGIGRMLIIAISQRDFPVIQGTILFLAIMMVLINLIVDLLYGILDPRIRIANS